MSEQQGDNGKKPLTWEYLQTISIKEAEERMPEIQRFLEDNKQKGVGTK